MQTFLRRWPIVAVTLLLASSAVGACAGDAVGRITTSETLPVDSLIRLKSDSFYLTVGDNVLVASIVRSIAGDAIGGQPIHWSTEDSTVIAVDTDGIVSALSPGTGAVTAAYDNGTRVQVQVFVTSQLRAVARVVMSPSSITLPTGGTARVTVQALDADGVPVAGAMIAFTSDSTQVATARVTTTRTRELNQIYVVNAIGVGTTRVIASSDGATASAHVEVTATATPVASVTMSPTNVSMTTGATTRLTAQALDNTGHAVTGVPVAFASDATHVAIVDQTGLVTAIGPGTARITATSRGVSAFSQVLVSSAPVPVAQIQLTPPTMTLAVGSSSVISARALDSNGSELAGAQIVFASATPTLASVDAGGLVTAIAPGNAQITATSQSVTVTAPVTITPRSVAQLVLTPQSVSVAVGGSAPLVVQALDNTGAPVPSAVVSYTSNTPAIATVTQSGIVTGVAPGSTQIAVSSQGVNAFASVVVSQRPVSQVVLTQANWTLTAGATAQLVAQALDDTGTPVPGAVVAYVSGAPSVATVSPGGVITAVSPGTAQLTASSQGISAAATVVVTPRPVAQVHVTPVSVTLFTGATAPLSARAVDNTGAPVAGAVITYSSAATSVATVNAAGVITGIAPGTTLVTATSQGLNGTSTVTVAPRPLAQVTLTPSSASISAGNATQLTATGRDALGVVIPGLSATFVSDATSVATVNQSGVVTGVSAGTAHITATILGLSASSTVTVQPPATGLAIDVTTTSTFQTISGWEATAEIGESECDRTAFLLYRSTVLDKGVNEVGINRIRLELKSGAESPTDHFMQLYNGQITRDAYRALRYNPINDNSDPFTANPAGFQWSALDQKVDEIVNPIRQRLLARGEQLMISLNYVDFKGTPTAFNQLDNAEEYAELITEAFKHLQQKYGWVPNAVELLLEPDITPWNGTHLGRAVVATANRLRANGWNPDFVGPSTTAMAMAPTMWDQMRTIPGAAALLSELSYHRYRENTTAHLQAIDSRRTRDNVRTSMLEHMGSGIDDMIEDLTVANVSAWQEFSLAFCADGGVYLYVNLSSPSNPIVTLSANAQLVAQVFRYVRAGAVRVGATSANSSAAKTVAFRNTNGKHAVIVRTQAAQQLLIRGLPAGTYGVNYATASVANVSAADVVIGAGGSASVSIPAAGAITIYAR